MNRFRLVQIIFFLTVLFITPAYAQWPLYLDLNIGEVKTFSLDKDKAKKKHQIQIENIEHLLEDNLWYKLPELAEGKTIIGIRANILLNGEKITLLQRPYQLPVVHQGLQLYVENTRTWAEKANFQQIKNMKKEVRISVALEGENWGPENLLFPVVNYRWRSGVYNNTWGSVVPYNSLYYHRGEDFGILPNRLDLRSVLDGKITASPLPNGDGLSNAILVSHADNFVSRFAHVNTEHVKPHILPKANVKRGEVMAKTGNTYKRANAQFRDPHLHVNFEYQGNAVSTYPYLVAAYLRDYPDTILAVAGGYAHLLPGQKLELDASRTIVRKGHEIDSYTWKLNTGAIVNTAKTVLSYEKPGLYTEELIVKTKDGAEDRDYFQVRVFENRENKDVAYGWAYHSPVRGIKPGMSVLIWSRLVQTKDGVIIDFGDGSKSQKIDKEIRHSYKRPGIYTVTFTGNGIAGEPATIKMKIIVEK